MAKPKFAFLNARLVATGTSHSLVLEPDDNFPFLYLVSVRNATSADRVDAYLADGFGTQNTCSLMPRTDIDGTEGEGIIWSGKIPFIAGVILIGEFLECTVGDSLRVSAVVGSE